MTHTVLLVGARGYVGREMVHLLDHAPDFQLVGVTSRAAEAEARASLGGLGASIPVLPTSPETVASAQADLLVLGLPNGMAGPYITAAPPSTKIIDLSADYRHKEGWVYGLSDLHQDQIVGAQRVANPGCYATAALLALSPLRDLIRGTPSVFGLSGYSGAGTTPGPKNDPKRLADNILPYGTHAHGHQGEVGAALGTNVRFLPHVGSWFRGLLATCTVPLQPGTTERMAHERLKAAYTDNDTVTVQVDPPEITAVANTPNAIIGGVALDPETNVLSVMCVHDNLLKGAASQALANMRLMIST